MVNISKSGNAIKFEFTDSDHYLYGDGVVETPVNSLSLVIDESKFVVFKKAATNDTFITFDPANSNLSDKAGVIEFYKTNMVGSSGGGSGSGVTPSEVQEMIDESLDDYYDKDEVDTAFETVNAALSGKASVSDVTAVANDVSTLSGQVATKVATSDFNAYSAATDARLAEDEEVTAAALNDLDERIGDPYQKVSGLTIETDEEDLTPKIILEAEDDGMRNENVFNRWGIDSYTELYGDGGGSYSSGLGGGTISNSATDFPDENVTSERNLNISTDGFEQTTFENVDDGESQYTRYSSENRFEYSEGLTLSQQWYDDENDTTTNSNINIINNRDAETYIELTDGENSVKIETTGVTINDENVLTDGIITSAVTSGSTDDEIPTAKAVYDAIPTGGGATYSAGTNISIDTANTINCTLPITANSSSFIAGTASNVGNNTGETLIGVTSLFSTFNNQDNVIIGYNAKGTKENVVIGYNATGGSFNNYDWYNIAIGSLSKAIGGNRVAIGRNVTASGSTKTNINDQITVDTNNQVYIKDKTNTTDVCIQDAIAALGGLKFMQCTQAYYDSLVSGGTVDSSTIYFITNVVS